MFIRYLFSPNIIIILSFGHKPYINKKKQDFASTRILINLETKIYNTKKEEFLKRFKSKNVSTTTHNNTAV